MKNYLALALVMAAGLGFGAEIGYGTLISHRGESVDAPENTLPAFKTAVSRGFGFECDIYLSSDKRVFTFHDSNLKRTTNGAITNACKDVSWEKVLSKVDVGGWGKWKGSKFEGTRPALLEEVLELARDGRWIYVEVKPGPEIVPYIKEIFAKQKRATPNNVLFISFNKQSCRALKEQMPEYKVMWLTGGWSRKHGNRSRTAEEEIRGAREAKADGIDICFSSAIHTKEYVAKVRKAGLEFHGWTIDNYDEAIRGFENGMQTITTNRAKDLFDEDKKRGNLLENGCFDDEQSKAWGGNSYGEGPGHLEFHNQLGGGHVRLVKEHGPGATQLGQFVHLGRAERFRLCFLYRGQGCMQWRYYRKAEGQQKGETFKIRGEKVKLTGIANDMGNQLGAFNVLDKGDEWKFVEYVADVPKSVKGQDLYLQVNSQTFGGQKQSVLELKEIRLSEIKVPPPPPPPPPVKIKVEQSPKPSGYAPVKEEDPFRSEIRDGLLYRNGKPYFYVANGCEFGSSQSPASGMWLAKLLGYPATSLDPGGLITAKETDPTNATITTYANLGRYARHREAVRLGFFVDYFGAQEYKYSPLQKFASKHPDFAEAHHRLGHYLSWDYFLPIGRECKLAQRKSYFELVADQPQEKTLVELCREPGPEPSSKRYLNDFRKWAQKKYGTLTEANRVWRTAFATWDEVLPLHLKPTDVSSYMEHILLRRKARKEHQEFNLDWIMFVQDDITRMTAAEFADLRKEFPNFLYTVDVRGHNIESDGYCMFDPERIDELVDVFGIHFGAHSVNYRNEKYHLPTLLDQTSFPFFSYEFFRTNTKHPIVNSEDIITKACIPGSNAEAMIHNDVGALHGEWKFKMESKGEGEGWMKNDYDDSKWVAMKVPGCWDETDQFRSKSGVAWYRKRFVAKANRQDFEDGSHRFYLYGKGVAQNGTVWLNGHKLGQVVGWDSPYSFDVSGLLNYGGENVIAWRIDGSGYQNGLRFYCHILANDRIGETAPFKEKQYRMMLWPYIMRGTSGCWVWSWHTDWFRPYFPKMLKQMQVGAEVALRDLRFRRGNVAYLFGFTSNRGLPCSITKTHVDYLNWYNALEFSGVRPDVFGEKHFQDEINSGRYRLLVVPHTLYVSDSTYAKFKEYVENGGTAIITDDSFQKTFDHWNDTDIREFAKAHTDRVKVVSGKKPMEELMKVLSPYLPENEVKIEETAKTEVEMPLIERVLAGDANRKILYLANWGGMDHRLAVTLPTKYRCWRLSSVVGEFDRELLSGKINVTVPSQDVAVLLLESDWLAPRVDLTISEKRTQAIDHIVKLNQSKQDWKEKALWPEFKSLNGTVAVGKEIYPYVLDRLESFGVGSVESDIEKWTLDELRQYKLVVLPETITPAFYRKRGETSEKFQRMIRQYVEEGGNVLVMSYSCYTVNAYGYLLDDFLAHSFGVAKQGMMRDTKHCGHGDPNQVVAKVEPSSPFAAGGVREVQLYVGNALKPLRNSQAKNALVVQPDAEKAAGFAPMMYLELGKGKMFFSADTMAFQPFRIEDKDNAKFLVNVLAWLLDKKVGNEDRERFSRNLFLKTDDLKLMTKDY